MIDERWKYTDLSLLKNTEWDSGIADLSYDHGNVPALDSALYVVNGIVDQQRLPELPGGTFEIDGTHVTLHMASQEFRVLQVYIIGTQAAHHKEWHTQFDIHVAPHAVLEIHWHSVFDDIKTWHQNAINIQLEKQASLKQYFHASNVSDAIRFQDISVCQKASSHYESLTLSEGLALDRVDTQVLLEGEQATCLLRGFYRPTKKQQSNHYLTVTHQAPNSTSEQYYKGIIDDQAHAVFNTRVKVEPGADGTQSSQVNKNILLSSSAEIDTKPDLEIYADDVQCAHGATVGELDEQALFYLRSRGIDMAVAKQMLIDAFAADILSLLKDTKEHADA